MSISDPSKLLRLQVRAADPETEIFVINGHFHLESRGIGSLDTQLEPGIYKLKSRAGLVTREQHVVLRDQPVSINLSRFAFASAAPLGETSKTHEYHIGNAESQSRRVHLKTGLGSWLFVFARDWTQGGRPPISWNPATGLSIRDEQGNPVADLISLAVSDLSGDPWAACNVEVNPGIYRLRLELPPREGQEQTELEQTIVASSGWQTQIFLLQRAYGSGPSNWRADLAGASILLSRGPGFDVKRSDFRQTELARLGLTNRRQVLSKEVRGLLGDKFENPMLGIFAAHLLLLDKEPDLALLRAAVSNLRRLLDTPHPDVEALALQFEPSGPYVFRSPPMLRRSWSLIVSATTTRPDAVPIGSLAAKISDRLWGVEPWLLWMPPEQARPVIIGRVASDAEVSPRFTQLEAVLQSHLSAQALPVGRSSKSTSPFAAVAKMRSGATDIGRLTAAEPRPAPTPVQKIASATPQPQLDEARIQELVEALGIPQASLRELLAKVYSKMSGVGGLPHFGDENNKT